MESQFSTDKHRFFLDSSTACRRRALDIERVRAFLAANDFQLCSTLDEANVLVFYGCCLNGTQKDASLERLKRKAASISDVVVVGGMTTICDHSVLAEQLSGRLYTAALDDVGAMDKLFARKVSLADVSFGNFSRFDKTTWSIMVGHGCDSGCTYCGDRPIVGPLRSCDLESITRQMEMGREKGYTKFDLVGDDVGAWGRDIGLDVTRLLDVATSFPGEYSVSLQEVNIKYLIRHARAFESILCRGKIDFLVVAFQHVNNRVLEQMKRGYTGAEVDALVRLLEKYEVKIRFHALMGFPSESREELKENLDFISGRNFVSGSCFLYRPCKYAPASSYAGHFSEDEQCEIMEYSYSRLSKGRYAVERKWSGRNTDGPPYKLLVTARRMDEDRSLCANQT